jgi:sarcosine oxidase subunit beta
MKRDSEIVVIGCGIIGTAIAYYLTSVGREVLILEKSIPAAGSSGACDGTIFIQSKQPGPKAVFALAGTARPVAAKIPVENLNV